MTALPDMGMVERVARAMREAMRGNEVDHFVGTLEDVFRSPFWKNRTDNGAVE